LSQLSVQMVCPFLVDLNLIGTKLCFDQTSLYYLTCLLMVIF
jgi:hypothetical protein